MEDAANDEPALPSTVHCTMNIGKAHAHYMNMVRVEREKKLKESQADAVDNLQLLKEHR